MRNKKHREENTLGIPVMYNPKKLEVGVRLVVNEDPQLANAIAEQKKAMAKQVTASDNKASKAGGAAAAAAQHTAREPPSLPAAAAVGGRHGW